MQVTDNNYNIALHLLNSEFINENAIVDDLLKKLLEIKPKYDTNYLETKIFIGETRCLLSDLSIYNYDFLEEKSGSRLVSHIVFSKLPIQFQRELVRRLGNNYPSLKDIFDNYVEVIRTLNLSVDKLSRQGVNTLEFKSNPKTVVNRTTSVANPKITNKSSFSTKFCKFCASTSHNMISCQKYATYNAHKQRCIELKMCSSCSSQKHEARNCNKQLSFPCFHCNSLEHIAALCDKTPQISSNFCINSSSDSGKTFLLPLICLNIGVGNKTRKVRFLLDTGSQRSYLSDNILREMQITLENETNLVVNTFIDSDTRSFGELAVLVAVENQKFSIPFLISDSFDLNFTVQGLKQAHSNISKEFVLQDKLANDQVTVEGLIGIDVVQCFKQFEIVPCQEGSAFRTEDGLIPFGNIDSFLTSRQLQTKYSDNSHTGSEPLVNHSLINFALNPVKTRFDPIGSVIRDSYVEDRLDDMFSLETLGIPDSSTDYDMDKIEEFNNNIVFEDGSYGVNLPWKENVPLVPHNFYISCSILDKVVENLRRDNLYDQYKSVLQKQLDEGIIEEVPISQLNIENHKFVPHRPVIKTEDNVTTKLRVVLNCSFKVGNSISLNEAAYTGIDLVNNLLQLLLRIRSDRTVVMSDIRAAFLMIKLNLESDWNKFIILWRNESNQLIAYRYTSIVFGFTSSPFILQHVIQFHLKMYARDHCFSILKDGMYVDNLFFNGNYTEFLENMYRQTRERMAAGGFELRSWTSNDPTLRQQFVKDGVATSPDNPCEKLLGYRYVPETDDMMINKFDTTSEPVPTKRTILSYVSRMFDPLGFFLPISIKAKLLIKDLWIAKLDWDEPVSSEIISVWIKIKADLDSVQNLYITRQAFSGETTIIIFCESSTVMYGFTCYVKSGDSCNLLMAKSRSAPSKSKTLPTLELMSFYLALLCLPSILDSLNGVVADVYICGDSQVALSWVLTRCVKTKNQFAKNRVKDISKFREDICDKYNLNCNFKYVPTDENPADLLTRGKTFQEFERVREFWFHGPDFIRQTEIRWPEKALGSLSPQCKVTTLHLSNDSDHSTIFPIGKYSSLNKALRVTALVLKFISKLKKKSEEKLKLLQDAKLYWMKAEQARYFVSELTFLQKPNNRDVPALGNNLNLSIDSDGLVRSKGRLSKCTGYVVNNPVLMPRSSYWNV